MEIRSNSFNAPQNRRLDITLPNRETIAENKPKPVSTEDVRARSAEQRQLAKERAENVRQSNQLAQRAENARQIRSERIANARSIRSDRVGNARRQAGSSPADGPRAAGNLGRAEAPSISQSDRAADVRAAQLAERSQGAREHRADRIGNARDQVELSETSMRARARASERANLASEKAERLHELRNQFDSGTLNTKELIAKAAFKMLSGEGE